MRTNKTKAFTLVELLLSVAIMGIIVGIGGDVFATVIRAYRRAEIFGLTEKNGNFILTSIEQDIRSAINVAITPNANSGNKIVITKATPTGTENVEYEFSFCSGTDSGNVTRDGDNLLSAENPISASNLFILPMGSSDPIVRIEGDNESRHYDIVYVSFVLAASCSDSETYAGYYQTTVNLRGGIQ